MQINKNCDLVLTDVFEYDIASCHYNLLTNIGWDVSQIPLDDKKQRNIAIGKLQIGNPRIAKYLLEQTLGIVQYYVDKNNVKEDDIIIRLRDGIFLRTKLKDNTSSLPIEFKDIYSKMIITIDRKYFLLIGSKGQVKVKGVPNKPIDTTFYNLFRNLNYSNKKSLTQGLEYIRQAIFKSNNVDWFTFKKNDDEYYVPIRGIGEIKVAKAGVRYLDEEEIDKSIVWENYVWPFCQSILLYCK